MAASGYHTAANTIEHDDMFANIEATLSAELGALQLANSTQQQSNLTAMADLRAALAATQQQLANLASAPPHLPTPSPHQPGHLAQPPLQMPVTYPPIQAPAAYPSVYMPQHARPSQHNGARRNRTGRYQQQTLPYQPPAHPTMHMQNLSLPIRNVQPPIMQPLPAPYLPNMTMAGTANRRITPPNPNKRFNNHNYCYSCGFDVPAWHTSATCPTPNAHHQPNCTRNNVAQYAALGHYVSRKAAHKTVMPTNPLPHLA